MGLMKKRLPNQKELEVLSQEHWQKLQTQIDASKALADEEQKTKRGKSYTSKKKTVSKNVGGYTNKPRYDENYMIEINEATKEELIKLRGIGDVLSTRMIKYRDKLGGFYDIQQVSEVYGISDSLFLALQKHMKVTSQRVKKIHLNQAELNQLKGHPYISWKLANQIINYREKVKPFDSVEETRKLYAINDSIYNKLLPYLTID